MLTEKALQEFDSQKRRYEQAKNRNAGISFEKERLKNLLFNYCDDLLSVAEDIQKVQEEKKELQEKVDVLNKSVEVLTKKLNEANRQKKDKTSPPPEE